MFLMTFAVVALVVGSFVIYNTFSITVAQRTKETALVRAIGAKRKQVTRAVMIEALFTGIVASAIGVLAGLGASEGLRSVLEGFGLQLPGSGSVVVPASLITAGVVGVVVTVVAAYLPARKAAKVAPIEALRDAAIDRSATSKRRAVVGTLLAAVGGWFVASGLSAKRARSRRHGRAGRVRRPRGARSGHRPPAVPGAGRGPAPPAWRARQPGPGERVPEPAAHGIGRLGADDRRRPGGVHHGVRGVGEGERRHLGRHRRCGPTGSSRRSSAWAG